MQTKVGFLAPKYTTEAAPGIVLHGDVGFPWGLNILINGYYLDESSIPLSHSILNKCRLKHINYYEKNPTIIVTFYRISRYKYPVYRFI